VDRAAPSNLLWWMARHCVRLLTALAIFAAALGATAPASATPAADTTVSMAAEHAQVAVAEEPDVAVVPEPEPVAVVVERHDLAEPVPAYLAAQGQRAPPAV
jgi:hypothetical protein